jgi:folate-binding protein YgfZ
LAPADDVTPGAHALAHGAGIVALDDATWIVVGSQARDFLHRMLTQDVRSMRLGETRRACLLDAKGRVHLDLLVRVENVIRKVSDISRIRGEPRSEPPLTLASAGPVFTLVVDRAAGERSMAELERYVIADDVQIHPLGNAPSHAWVVGERVAQVLSTAAGVEVDVGGEPAVGALGGVPVLTFPRDLGGRPGVRVMVWPTGPDAGARVHEALREAGGVDATPADFAQARVETGTPWWGSEIDERVMPTEAGLIDAVSFTKGCYLGQEPVTMSKHRGHPPTLLCRFVLGTGAAPAPGSALFDGERKVGRLTTVVPGMALGYAAFASAKAGASFRFEAGDAPATLERVLA